MNNRFKILFENLCCSICKSDFNEKSIKVLREEKNIFVVDLFCQNCGKEFGVAFIGLSDESKNKYDTQLYIYDGLPPITKDDVLDTHDFLKDLDEHWMKYLP